MVWIFGVCCSSSCWFVRSCYRCSFRGWWPFPCSFSFNFTFLPSVHQWTQPASLLDLSSSHRFDSVYRLDDLGFVWGCPFSTESADSSHPLCSGICRFGLVGSVNFLLIVLAYAHSTRECQPFWIVRQPFVLWNLFSVFLFPVGWWKRLVLSSTSVLFLGFEIFINLKMLGIFPTIATFLELVRSFGICRSYRTSGFQKEQFFFLTFIVSYRFLELFPSFLGSENQGFDPWLPWSSAWKQRASPWWGSPSHLHCISSMLWLVTFDCYCFRMPFSPSCQKSVFPWFPENPRFVRISWIED